MTFWTPRLSVTFTRTVTVSVADGDDGVTIGVPMEGGVVSAGGAWARSGTPRMMRLVSIRQRESRIFHMTLPH